MVIHLEYNFVICAGVHGSLSLLIVRVISSVSLIKLKVCNSFNTSTEVIAEVEEVSQSFGNIFSLFIPFIKFKLENDSKWALVRTLGLGLLKIYEHPSQITRIIFPLAKHF